jgi:hypothetical protein
MNFAQLKRRLPTMRDQQTLPMFTLMCTLLTALALALVFAQPASAQTESVLFDFVTGDGAQGPGGSLTMDSAGNLYGIAGSNQEGAAYELSPSAGGTYTLKILHEFTSLSDGIPAAGLIMDSAGNLYGTCFFGGTSYYGTVYELEKISNGTWRKKVLDPDDSAQFCRRYRRSGSGWCTA